MCCIPTGADSPPLTLKETTSVEDPLRFYGNPGGGLLVSYDLREADDRPGRSCLPSRVRYEKNSGGAGSPWSISFTFDGLPLKRTPHDPHLFLLVSPGPPPSDHRDPPPGALLLRFAPGSESRPSLPLISAGRHRGARDGRRGRSSEGVGG